MKLKSRPEDFRVEEKLRLELRKRGRYAVYQVEKRYWNTLDVIRELEHKYRLQRVSRAGLKDRYSLSTQFLSALPGGPRAIKEKNFSAVLVGHSDEPVSRDILLGNRFTIVLRALRDSEAQAVLNNMPLVKTQGFPNYYDEQRVGSARHGQGFIARKLIAGHYNGALKLLAATPSALDDRQVRRSRTLVAENWGDWQKCLPHVDYQARPAFKHLAKRKSDFKGAVKLLPRTMLELFINAYQAWLWNETLSGVLARLKLARYRLGYSQGEFSFYDRLTPRQLKYLLNLTIPAPAPSALTQSDRVAEVMNEVLCREGLELKDLRLKLRLRSLFFKSWDRSAVVVPRNCNVSQPKPDELYPGRSKLTLGFFLPPGSYATMVTKRLTLG
ncbi:MAG: tRNA pseudouridine(13) synthase TruD [candidate division WOR-3 bacterium]|nr:MAG: tRNA pseudouridine(13) synthase TruD [candidate division WOR-3 bacterium]